jgi:hypothetical protein
MIKEVLSPILYKAIIHNKVRVVHAVNMKPANKKRKFIKRTVNLDKKVVKVKQKTASKRRERDKEVGSEDEDDRGNFSEEEGVVVKLHPYRSASYRTTKSDEEDEDSQEEGVGDRENFQKGGVVDKLYPSGSSGQQTMGQAMSNFTDLVVRDSYEESVDYWEE